MPNRDRKTFRDRGRRLHRRSSSPPLLVQSFLQLRTVVIIIVRYITYKTAAVPGRNNAPGPQIYGPMDCLNGLYIYIYIAYEYVENVLYIVNHRVDYGPREKDRFKTI